MSNFLTAVAITLIAFLGFIIIGSIIVFIILKQNNMTLKELRQEID